MENRENNKVVNLIQRGQIWYAKMIGEGSMQNGIRPCIVCQNDIGNRYSSLVSLIPLTSKTKRMLPTHTVISVNSGLDRESIALAENIVTIPKQNLVSYIGKVSDTEMNKINQCMMIQLGLVTEYEVKQAQTM